jgi:hypothetical protein
MVGEKLKLHFPHQRDDVNELADDISFDNNKELSGKVDAEIKS